MKHTKALLSAAVFVLVFTGCASTEKKASKRIEPVRPVTKTYYEMPKVTDCLTYSFDPSTKYQTIDGFGAAYTWYSNWLFNNGNTGEDAFDSLFSYAGLSILRFKNEYEYERAGYASNGNDMAKYYKAAEERFAEIGEKPIVLMCCWSPAAYLKSNNKIEGKDGATLKKNADGKYCYEEYAKWWTDSIKYYNSLGINIDYVSIQNEVEFVASYDGCRFDATETSKTASYAKAFVAVYRAFKKEFGDKAPKLLAPETMSCVWSTIHPYIKEIEKLEPESVAGIAHHLYVGGNASSDEKSVDPGSFINNFMNTNSHYESRKIWQTEYYIGHAIQQAELINNCLIYENVNGYLFWSGVWSTTNNQFEKADLSGVQWSGAWSRKAKYYVMRHFSEYIRPGYTRIKAASGTGDVKTSAYVSPDGKTVVLVLINVSNNPVGYNFSGYNFNIKNFHAYESVFGDVAKDENACWINRGSFKGNDSISLWPKSVTTVVINK